MPPNRFRIPCQPTPNDRSLQLALSLQHSTAACLDRLPGTDTGGARAGTRRMAGRAISTSFPGHVPAGAKADPKLKFNSDHLVGADQSLSDRVGIPLIAVSWVIIAAALYYIVGGEERLTH